MTTSNRDYKLYDLLMATFVTVLLISNLLSSAKIIDLQASLGEIPLIFDAGTLVFPLSYIFGDILTEVYGFRRSRRVIWTGFAASLLMGFFVWLAGILPGESLWAAYAGQEAYDAILGGISGLIIASLAAYLFGEFTNSAILSRMKIWTQGRYVWARTIGSTLGGQAVDTSIFVLIATWLGVFMPDQALPLIVTNYLFKVGIEVLLTPVTLITIKAVKRIEREDHYDYNISLNPFL